jgi:hypothetical protein
MLPYNFGQIVEVDFFLSLPTIPSALSHERESVGKKNIRSFCEHEGVFKPFRNLRAKLTFHLNLIPNLEKMKIFIPGVEIS